MARRVFVQSTAPPPASLSTAKCVGFHFSRVLKSTELDTGGDHGEKDPARPWRKSARALAYLGSPGCSDARREGEDVPGHTSQPLWRSPLALLTIPRIWLGLDSRGQKRPRVACATALRSQLPGEVMLVLKSFSATERFERGSSRPQSPLPCSAS